MRIGFDIDGVLANFIPAYQALTVKVAGGVDLFQPGDDIDPPCWSWPEFRGYSAITMRQVWNEIKASHDFWLDLPETPDCSLLRKAGSPYWDQSHDIYFVTNRVGQAVKWQTEQWLGNHLWVDQPTVLISSEKGLVAKALKLDCYIEDNYDNAIDVAKESPNTRIYLVNRRYNVPSDYAHEHALVESRRVSGIGEFLRAENLIPYTTRVAM
jgi:hypothetical protein